MKIDATAAVRAAGREHLQVIRITVSGIREMKSSL
jgi:hypothetical protein